MDGKKAEILREFSSEPGRYYAVELFADAGFARVPCDVCGRFFWTLDASRTRCPDDATDTYSFIGDPPTARRFDYAQAWEQVRTYFEDNGHAAIGRYPVVCRWRDDLYFTIASIVDFQRVMGSKVVFEFPANPLVVPQTCLRFKDLENVGVTGRHFSSFCMVGQHSVPDMDGGYWKDECIRLDYGMLTGPFGIAPEEIVFVEDVWAGGGSFGPSLEYFVRGLELGNAVFTEFQGELGRHTTLDRRIIDMGAGLERLAWITMGTPTAYDCCFGGVDAMIRDALGISDADPRMLGSYYTEVAKTLDRCDDLWDVRRRAMRGAGISDHEASRVIGPLEDSYMIADHVRTLIFAISDGALPSNVGGGYNLRMMIRRIGERIRRLGASDAADLDRLVDAHIDYLRGTYPELDSKRDDIKQILRIETGRYAESRSMMQKKVAKVQRRGGPPDAEALVVLYDSDGITPEYLVEQGVISEVPSDFYSRISELHQSDRGARDDAAAAAAIPDGIPDTELLYYGDDPREFEATVLWSRRNVVVLDRTSFYARGGGQEPDHGTIDGRSVADVQNHAGVILHVLEDGGGGSSGGETMATTTTTTKTKTAAAAASATPNAGSRVRCVVDSARRDAITKHHTSTHILNASSRRILGSWVWQHSAFKDVDHARLDITHHSPLSGQQVRDIEDAANAMVSDNLPVSINYMERGEAEQRYGFSIYQGGVVPVKAVRIVSISDVDIEACGGTHVPETGRIKKIRITRTKRIQDGVVRLEFVSGDAAYRYEAEQRRAAEAAQKDAAIREETRRRRDSSKEEARKAIPDIIRAINEAVAAATVPDAAGNAAAANGITAIDAPEGVRVFVGRPAPHERPDSQDDTFAESPSVGRADARVVACMVRDTERGEHFHTNLGKRMAKEMPHSAYVGFFAAGPTVRVVAYAGAGAVSRGVNASEVAAAASAVLGGGSSHNDAAFSQGGGTNTSRVEEAAGAAESAIRGMLSGAVTGDP
ncbi:MAG: alanine--tRNA ligase [Nitrosopumilaceae archaeon]|nr:alanine--tRNA ligase [Nitrosopumilaceae archaeon]